MRDLLLALALASISSACGAASRAPDAGSTASVGPTAADAPPRAAVRALAVEATVEATVEPEAAAAARLDPSAEVRAPTDWAADLRWSPAERLAHARRARGAEVERLFDAAGVAFPPREVLLRVFKREAQLELWAGDGAGPLSRVATYGICAASGDLGPKRAEGDRQVPEGFYRFGYFAPGSAWYLAALVDYPNLSDRIRGGPDPGGQILLHGRCASIGCISMGDERMEELYLATWASWREGGQKPHVHVFPARDLDALLADPRHAAHHAFWRELREGHAAFEATRRIPDVTIRPDGAYVVRAPRGPAGAAPASPAR